MKLAFKAIPFLWADQGQEIFETLNDTLMKGPSLVYMDPNKPYTLFMDASNIFGPLY